MKLLLALTLALMAVGCGYGSHTTTPPGPGNIPTIAALVPNNANSGGPAFVLEVDGTLFASQATVNFNNVSYAATLVSSGKLQAMIPGTAIASAGMVQVTVTNPATKGGPYGGGTKAETSAPMTFTIN